MKICGYGQIGNVLKDFSSFKSWNYTATLIPVFDIIKDMTINIPKKEVCVMNIFNN